MKTKIIIALVICLSLHGAKAAFPTNCVEFPETCPDWRDGLTEHMNDLIDIMEGPPWYGTNFPAPEFEPPTNILECADVSFDNSWPSPQLIPTPPIINDYTNLPPAYKDAHHKGTCNGLPVCSACVAMEHVEMGRPSVWDMPLKDWLDHMVRVQQGNSPKPTGDYTNYLIVGFPFHDHIWPWTSYDALTNAHTNTVSVAYNQNASLWASNIISSTDGRYEMGFDYSTYGGNVTLSESGVWSNHAWGFTRTVVPQGEFRLVANSFSQWDYSISNLLGGTIWFDTNYIATVYHMTTISPLISNAWGSVFYELRTNTWIGNDGYNLYPGEGFLIHSPVDYVNLVMHGRLLEGTYTNRLPAGWCVASMINGGGGNLDSLNFPTDTNTVVFLMRPTGWQAYYPTNSCPGGGSGTTPCSKWGNSIPVLRPGEAALVYNSTAKEWIQEGYSGPNFGNASPPNPENYGTNLWLAVPDTGWKPDTSWSTNTSGPGSASAQTDGYDTALIYVEGVDSGTPTYARVSMDGSYWGPACDTWAAIDVNVIGGSWNTNNTVLFTYPGGSNYITAEGSFVFYPEIPASTTSSNSFTFQIEAWSYLTGGQTNNVAVTGQWNVNQTPCAWMEIDANNTLSGTNYSVLSVTNIASTNWLAEGSFTAGGTNSTFWIDRKDRGDALYIRLREN